MGVFSRADHAFQKLNIGVKKSIGKDAGQRVGMLPCLFKQEMGVCGYGWCSWFSPQRRKVSAKPPSAVRVGWGWCFSNG
jgi:hypothetical protein